MTNNFELYKHYIAQYFNNSTLPEGERILRKII